MSSHCNRGCGQSARGGRLKDFVACALLLLSLAGATTAATQHRPMDVPDTTDNGATPTRTRLILKDGSYQMALGFELAGKFVYYQVVGNIVHFRSAERNGEEEEIPLALVDLPATDLWTQQHTPGVTPPPSSQPVLTPELAKEEAARAALMPEIAPDLHLPEEDSVLVLDTFRGSPELVPLPQAGSDLNNETAHAVFKGSINPLSSPHRIADIPRERADVQLHVSQPIFFVRLKGDDDAEVLGGGAFTVDTHGASGRATPSGGDPNNPYVIERVDVRSDERVLDSFRLSLLGTGRRQPDIIETRAEPLPGGRWMKLTPLQPLDFGEYALVEVLGPDAVNLDAWPFGVHSDAPENIEAIHPEQKRAPSLERRRPY